MLELLSFGRKTITNTINIYVKTNTGKTLSVNLEPQWDIKNVKQLVAPQLGLQPNEVKIIFAGKELSDATTIEVRSNMLCYETTVLLIWTILRKECDLGQQSILHAIRMRPVQQRQRLQSTLAEEDAEEQPCKPLCETLVDLQLQSDERNNISEESNSPLGYC